MGMIYLMHTKTDMFKRLNEESRLFLERGYLSEGETAEERIRYIADTAEKILKIEWFSDKFYSYMGEGFYSLSSPIRSNFWLERWLPIACFWGVMDDTTESILAFHAEIWMMNKYGWGTSWDFSRLRPRWAEIKNNGKSSWAVHFMEMFSKLIDTISQWKTRRWAFSPYLSADHGDIHEFLTIWTEGNEIQNCTTWVYIPEWWMEEMMEWDKDKWEIWGKILESRTDRWYPYIMFGWNVEEGKPEVYKKSQMPVLSSNLCQEINLPCTLEESFVCCLSSMNVEEYDRWKGTDAVETMVLFLNAVLDEFIDKVFAMEHRVMDKAMVFAERHRALWIGVLWRHNYLQKHMIPFGSKEAQEKNIEVFSFIKERSYQASEELYLAKYKWTEKETDLMKISGRANTTTMAVAPTKSSSFILGQMSPSIEPVFSNVIVKDLAKGKFVVKNKYLEQLLEEKGINTSTTRKSIKEKDWSVQYLEELTDQEKDVFKTFEEINQYDIIYQAALRQQFIDQWQSLNLRVHTSMTPGEISNMYIEWYEAGVKWFYYQHGTSAAQDFSRWCSSCEA